MKPRIAMVAVAAGLMTAYPFHAAVADDSADTGRHLRLGFGLPEPAAVEGYVGVGAGILPVYEGADEVGATAQPLANIRYPGLFFLKGASVNPNDGLASAGLTVLNLTYTEGSDTIARISLGPLVRYRGGRNEDDSDALSGMGDVDDSIEVGGFLEASAGPLSAEISVAQDAGGGHDGLLVAFGTKYTAPVSDRLTVAAGLSSSWADADYTQTYFGVSSVQASQSGLAAFDGGSGFKDVGLQIEASYAVSENWVLIGQAGYQRLLTDAADSPLVDQEGSADQFLALIGVAYRF